MQTDRPANNSILRLSIIIPLYNVAEFIERCVLSLEQQDIAKEEYELIMINDGSPDNSREVVLGLMQQFKNIVFIEQENKGVSLARNAGIDKALGRYLLFIDPDDYIAPNRLKRVLKTAEDQDAQITFLGYRFLLEDNTVKKEILFNEYSNKLYVGIEAYPLSRGDGTTDPDRSVAILYERAFMNRYDIRYIADIPYLEDGEFLARVLCLATKCIFEGNPFYIRTTRPGSATHSRLFHSGRAIKGFVKSADNLFQFQQNKQLTSRQRIFLNQPICKFMLLAIYAGLNNDDGVKLKDVVADLKNKGLHKCPLKGCKKVYKRDGFFFNLSPWIYAVYKPVWSIFQLLSIRLLKVHI